VTGLSELVFSLVMGSMTAAGFLFVFRFLQKATGDRRVALPGFLAVVSVCYLADKGDPFDPYFQYQPIRFFFPAASLGIVWAWCRRPLPARHTAMCALASLAVLWNLDSGVVVFGAWLALVTAECVLRREYVAAPLGLARCLGVLTAVVTAFSGLLFLRYGRWPDWSLLIEYQMAYYGKGLYMLPMPLIGTWVVVIIVYAAGMTNGIAAILEGRRSARALMGLYLSVLGCGLFAYYQGRSVAGALWLVSYPAIALCLMGVGFVSRRVRAGDRGLRPLLCVVAAIGGLAVAAVAVKGAVIVGITYRRMTASATAPLNPAANISFLREHLRPGEEVLFLGYHSGVYHLATGTTCALPIPGVSELILARDHNRITQYLTGPARKVVVDTNYLPEASLRVVEQLFPGHATGPSGRLIVFER